MRRAICSMVSAMMRAAWHVASRYLGVTLTGFTRLPATSINAVLAAMVQTPPLFKPAKVASAMLSRKALTASPSQLQGGSSKSGRCPAGVPRMIFSGVVKAGLRDLVSARREDPIALGAACAGDVAATPFDGLVVHVVQRGHDEA